MACRNLFWENTHKSFIVFWKHWEDVTDTKFTDVGKIIFSKIKFDCRHHQGSIIPQYYTRGIPSMLWTCRSCLEIT